MQHERRCTHRLGQPTSHRYHAGINNCDRSLPARQRPEAGKVEAVLLGMRTDVPGDPRDGDVVLAQVQEALEPCSTARARGQA